MLTKHSSIDRAGRTNTTFWRDWAVVKSCWCFFSPSSGGQEENTRKQNPQKILGQSGDMTLFMCFVVCWSFLFPLQDDLWLKIFDKPQNLKCTLPIPPDLTESLVCAPSHGCRDLLNLGFSGLLSSFS